MVKTLLLCFIHGFKGDDETTFHDFPDNLQKLVVEKEPELNVHTVVYPKYETRGDLAACVETFREWLQDQVTDLETNAATPMAILNPSVSVILIAHSMGGFVAADTLFSVLDHRPVSADPTVKLMFPLIQGVMCFDTPYNGLSRSMFAYGAFSQYQNLSSIWNIGASVGSLISSGGASAATAASSQALASQNQSWKRWQLLAARTGTYGAIIAGGVAAYMNRAEIADSLSKVNRENISQSWSKVNRERVYEGLSHLPAYVSRDSIGEGFAWMASHLKFVGALMKQVQLKTRLERLSQMNGVGLVNFYTSLGENGYWTGGYFVPKRTFCAIPTDKVEAQLFREQTNTKASDEIAAHCSMFQPLKNLKYEEMSAAATDLILEWAKNDPRKVVDDYQPSKGQRERSMSEAQLWDDDGKVIGQKEARKDGNEEDELQLKAILSASGMPQPEDGGLSDEEVKKAAEVPLPSEEVSEEAMKQLWDGDGEAAKTWRSRFASPWSGVSMPTIPNMPNMPMMPGMPSMSSLRIPGRKQTIPDSAPDPDAGTLSDTEEIPKDEARNKEIEGLNTNQTSDEAKKETTTQEVKENTAAPLSVIRSPVEQQGGPPIPIAATFDGDALEEKSMQQNAEEIDLKSAEQQTVPIESAGKTSKRSADEMSKDDEGPKADKVLKEWTQPQGCEALRAEEVADQDQEVPKAGKIPMEAPMPVVD